MLGLGGCVRGMKLNVAGSREFSKSEESGEVGFVQVSELLIIAGTKVDDEYPRNDQTFFFPFFSF